MSFGKDIMLDPIGLKLYKEFVNIAEKGEPPESDEFFRELTEYVMKRGYLSSLSERMKFIHPANSVPRMSWARLSTLPVPQEQIEKYDLLHRWQGALSTIHKWGQRVMLLLMRRKGITKLYLASAANQKSGINEKQAGERLKQVMKNSMPGIGIEGLDTIEAMESISIPLTGFQSAGIITGVPSFRKDMNFGLLQTLDKLAVGLKDDDGNEMDYCVAIISEPIADTEIEQMISKMRLFIDEIHPQAKVNQMEGISKGQSYSIGVSVDIVRLILSACGCFAGVSEGGGHGVTGGGLGFSIGTAKNIGIVKTTSRERINSFAQYAEDLTKKHINRLEQGRNLGFWNTGVYVFTDFSLYTETVMGILHSIYSGDESYIEPFRMHSLHAGSDAVNIMRGFQLVPLEYDTEEWHMFGKSYQYASTPVNTEELSLIMSLPRNDVPGVRAVKIAERFANNPADTKGINTITLGPVMDIGVPQSTNYTIPIDALVRHALVTGSTGFGKSTTCWRIVHDVMLNDIPVLIIEPGNDFFVKKAIVYNEIPGLPDNKKIDIYMPGIDSYHGVATKRLKLNPFQPAHINVTKRDILSRVEMITSIFSLSMPAADVLPVLIEETLFKCVEKLISGYESNNSPVELKDYPKLENAVYHARELLKDSDYEPMVKANLSTALVRRFTILTRGNRGDILNVNNSTPYNQLFDRPTIINLSNLAPDDQALISALIVLSLNEYRKSQYHKNWELSKKKQTDKLLHLTVIEEAHNILQKPQPDFLGVGNAQKVVADMFSNILSQIRALGQGIILVDQIPSRLVEDAVKNTNYKIVHRLNTSDEAEMMAVGLCLRPDQIYVIPKLGQGYVLVYGDKDDAASLVWVKEE